MLFRILALALNTYREAVRARVLLGLFALAVATSLYSLVVGAMSLQNQARVIADLGAASTSLYSIIVAVVLGATLLHREIELKTIFPILSRPLFRHEYLLGKFFGILLTVVVFAMLDTALVLVLLAVQAGASGTKLAVAVGILLVLLLLLLVRAPRQRVFVLVPWAAIALGVAIVLCAEAPSERRVVLSSACLTIAEVAIVTGVAMLFSSFSSPFLTAVFTFGVFVVGRSADTLANLPIRFFGETVRSVGRGVAAVIPHLDLYVPPRALLLGEVPTRPVWSYVATAAGHAVAYTVILLVVASLIFRRRDFA